MALGLLLLDLLGKVHIAVHVDLVNDVVNAVGELLLLFPTLLQDAEACADELGLQLAVVEELLELIVLIQLKLLYGVLKIPELDLGLLVNLVEETIHLEL